ncbi:MAG: hypothetical protein HDQ95_02005 [Roseburia sp.]|nr:hypothetical protein [Roseburia sp.]
MVQSILDIILVTAYMIGFVINPLHREKRNGFSLCVVGIMLLIFWVGLAAGICTVAGLPITLTSINVAVMVAVFAVWMLILIKKKISCPAWSKKDAIELTLVTGFALFCCIVQFGWKLDLRYGDVDPARYMNMAMELIRNEKVSGAYLTTLINAWFIMICKPFLLPISYYRAFVLSDIFMHLLSIGMFYSLISQINRGKARIFNFVLTLLYFCGYQLYNLCYGAFFHWVDGILIIMFLIYAAIMLEREQITVIEGIMSIGAGFFGLLICYPFFLLIVIPMLLPEAVLWCIKNFSKLNFQKKGMLLVGIMLLFALGIFFAGQRIENSFDELLRSLQVDGLAYREPYMDFVFFVPVILCLIGLLKRRKEENPILLRMTCIAVVFMVVWFYMMLSDHISVYYYYRMYYVLWLLAWLAAGQTIHILMEEGLLINVVSYGVFFLCMALLATAGVNERLYKTKDELFNNNQQYRSLFPLYRMNYNTMTSEKRTVLSEGEMQIYNYIIEEFPDTVVPIVHSVYGAMQADWYIGITSVKHFNTRYNVSDKSIEEIFHLLQIEGIREITVLKNDRLYTQYKDEIFDKLDVITQNEETVIYQSPEKGWLSSIDVNENFSLEDKELFSYVEDNYAGDYVPLLCERELYQKAKYYTIYTGMEVEQYWKLFEVDTFIPSTYILNNDGIEYVVVLKESKMYQENKEYFDGQKIVFENKAGMILQHAGTGWMPSEQS